MFLSGMTEKQHENWPGVGEEEEHADPMEVTEDKGRRSRARVVLD